MTHWSTLASPNVCWTSVHASQYRSTLFSWQSRIHGGMLLAFPLSLNWWNIHNRKLTVLTILKGTGGWHEAHSHGCTAISWTFSSSPVGTLGPEALLLTFKRLCKVHLRNLKILVSCNLPRGLSPASKVCLTLRLLCSSVDWTSARFQTLKSVL